jgi:hypothetical protein
MPTTGGLTNNTPADLAAATNTLLYTCPAGKTATAIASFCNRTQQPVKVRLAVGQGANPDNADYYEFDTQIPAGGTVERGGLILSPGDKVWAYASATGVTAKLHGIEV